MYFNKEIKAHFHTKVKKNVRRSIIPGNTQSLWKAVKLAKDTNTNELPNAMYLNGMQMNQWNFCDKISRLIKNFIRTDTFPLFTKRRVVVSIEFLSTCFQLTPLTGVNCTREATHNISC